MLRNCPRAAGFAQKAPQANERKPNQTAITLSCLKEPYYGAIQRDATLFSTYSIYGQTRRNSSHAQRKHTFTKGQDRTTRVARRWRRGRLRSRRRARAGGDLRTGELCQQSGPPGARKW